MNNRLKCIAPQVLGSATDEIWVMRDESSGTVGGIMKVADDEEALRLTTDSRYRLTASIWTREADAAEALAARIETGTVFLNRQDYLDPALCRTGCKQTGRGGARPFIGYQNLTRPTSYPFKKAET